MHNRPFDWAFVLAVVEHRLGMWVGPPTYERAVALVTGFDMAQADSVHPWLQERLSSRHNSGSVHWDRVLLAESLDTDVNDPKVRGPLTPEEDAVAIGLLVAELRAVLDLGTAD